MDIVLIIIKILQAVLYASKIETRERTNFPAQSQHLHVTKTGKTNSRNTEPSFFANLKEIREIRSLGQVETYRKHKTVLSFNFSMAQSKIILPSKLTKAVD